MENLQLKKKSFSNKKQLEKLVTLMEAKPLIAKNICKKSEADRYWEFVNNELNSVGPPVKTASKWAKVWIDLKAKLRKKLIHNKKEINSTGGGPNNLHVLTPLEEKISEFLSLETSISPPGREFGVEVSNNTECQTQSTLLDVDTEEVDLFTLSPSATEQQQKNKTCSSSFSNDKGQENIRHPPASKNFPNTAGQRLKLLEEHASDFKTLASEVKELKKYVKDTYEYTKKMYYLNKNTNKELINLKKEKLKLYKEEIGRKQKDRAAKLKLKMELLELQKSGIYNNFNENMDS